MVLKNLVLTRKYVLFPFDKLDYQKTVDLFFKKILFTYLTQREYKQGHQREGAGEAEGEVGSQVSRELDAGLNPKTLGS